MPYTAEISRSNPTSIIFLVDQSTSMSDPIGGEVPQQKADVVADAINRLLTELSVKCAKEEGVRDYFHVAVVGYGATVGSAFTGALGGRDIVPLSEVADNPARVDERTKKVPDGAGGLVETSVNFPLWMDPVAHGGTPMNRALQYAEPRRRLDRALPSELPADRHQPDGRGVDRRRSHGCRRGHHLARNG